MNLRQITEEVSNELNCTKKDGKKAVDAVIKVISEGLKEEGRCQLTGFGSFNVKTMKARKGRNPRNPDETYDIGKREQVTFRAGKTLKNLVNK